MFPIFKCLVFESPLIIIFVSAEPSSPIKTNNFNSYGSHKGPSSAATNEFENRSTTTKNSSSSKDTVGKIHKNVGENSTVCPTVEKVIKNISESSKVCTSNSESLDLKDQLISTQKKLISFYEEEWHGHLPPMILVTIQ